MMVKHKAVANELTESFDLISGFQKVILNVANDISDQTEELDTNLEDLVSEIFRPDFGRYTCRIQGPTIVLANKAGITLN